jgi:large subunit ribosomal protein L18
MITKSRAAKRRRLKRHIRIRITGSSERPRLTVFRSLRHVYAQIVDDAAGKTLVAVSDTAKDLRGDFQGLKGQVAVGRKVGEIAARRALEQGIAQVVFDRNGYLYHGAVKALADGARGAGLKF